MTKDISAVFPAMTRSTTPSASRPSPTHASRAARRREAQQRASCQGSRLALAIVAAAMSLSLVELDRVGAAGAPASTRATAPIAPRVKTTAAGEWAIDASMFGIDEITLPTDRDATGLLALPDGLEPVALRGQLVSDAPVRYEIEQVDGSIVRGQTDARDSFALRLDPAAAPPDPTTIEFAVRAAHMNAAECGPRPNVSVRRVMVAATGDARAASTIADFLPRFMDRLVIVLDRSLERDTGDYSTATADAVVRLSALATHRWPNTRVVVSAQRIATTPFDRVVVLREGSRGLIELDSEDGEQSLVLSGAGKELARLVEFLFSPASSTTFVRRLESDGIDRRRVETPLSTTMGMLDIDTSTAGARGVAERKISLAQSQFGKQLGALTISARGIVRSGTGEDVVVEMRAGDELLASKRVQSDHRFALTATLERGVLRRENEVVVRALDPAYAQRERASTTARQAAANQPGATIGLIDTAPSELALTPLVAQAMAAACASDTPMVFLDLDPRSTVKATAGVGVPRGFERFPQALMPRFDVRLGMSDVDALQSVASVVQLLQRMTPVRLLPTVASTTIALERASSTPMVYLGGMSDELRALDPPMDANPQADAQHAASVLQSFQVGTVDHLALTTDGSSSALRSLVARLESRREGWRSLTGDVFVEQGGRTRSVRIRPEFEKDVPVSSLARTRVRFALSFGFAIGLGLAAIGVALRSLLRRQE